MQADEGRQRSDWRMERTMVRIPMLRVVCAVVEEDGQPIDIRSHGPEGEEERSPGVGLATEQTGRDAKTDARGCMAEEIHRSVPGFACWVPLQDLRA